VLALECVSPADGRQFLALGEDGGNIALWDLSSRECVGSLVGHMGPVHCLASFSGSDGAPLLASGSRDKTIILWDVVTHTQFGTLSGHTNWVIALAVFSNASTGYECLASGSYDGTIVLWDPRKYCALATLRGHEDGVYSLCVCRDSSGADILASSGVDDLVRIWDLATHQTLFTLSGHESSVSSLSFFTNADRVPMLVSSGCKALRVWDLQSRVSVAIVHGASWSWSMACVAGIDGRVLAFCTGGRGDDAAVRLYDLSTGESAIELPILFTSASLAFVDQASGLPFLAISAKDLSWHNTIELFCPRGDS
jgi:WD40 repeat protein